MMTDFLDEIDADEEAFMLGISDGYEDLSTQTDMDVRLDYLLGHLSSINGAIAGNNEVAQRRRDAVTAWQQSENEKLEKRVAWLTFEIMAAAPQTGDAFKDSYGKKSRSLPNGSVGFRSGRDSVDITDMPAAVAYAQANAIDVTVKTTVAKTSLMAYVKATGDSEGDGWEVKPAAESFYVKAGT